MKKSIIMILISGVFFSACKKEPKDVSTVVTVGHPSITLIGPAIYSTPVGTGTYTDPGAVGYDDLRGDSVHLTTPVSSNVDLTTPGFYSVTYSFSNTNGYVSYTTTQSRLILVTPVSAAEDISGTYARISNGQTVTVTKMGTGLYTTDNVGGVPGNPSYLFAVYFGLTSDSTIQVPSQFNPLGGTVTCAADAMGANLNCPLTISPADTSFSWVVLGSGFGTSVRKFKHQ
jgi:hypothetical protein